MIEIVKMHLPMETGHNIKASKPFNISKEFKAHIAHYVPTQYLGKDSTRGNCLCRNIHGHTVKISPVIIGGLDEKTQMVIDYTLLKETIGEFIKTMVDHHFIISKDTFLSIGSVADLITIDSILYRAVGKNSIDYNSDYVYIWWNNFELKGTVFNRTVSTEHINYLDSVIRNQDDWLAVQINSFTILNCKATTAEKLSEFFAKVTVIGLSRYPKICKNIYAIGCEFRETETSSAYYQIDNPYSTFDDPYRVVDVEG